MMEARRLTREVLDALLAPFAAEQVQWKPQVINKDKTKALAVAYVDARDVAERLDQVTRGDWEFDFEVFDNGNVKGRLTVCGCTRCDLGDCDMDNDKGDVSDALKRCAVLFGVGRYLYRLPTTWVAYDARTKKLKAVPRLPTWAIPGGEKGPPEPSRGDEPRRQPKRPQRQDEPGYGEAVPDLDEAAAEMHADYGDVVMPFGKHSGMTVTQIFEDDPGYVIWLASDKFEPRNDDAWEVKDEANRIIDKDSSAPRPDPPPERTEVVEASSAWADVPRPMRLAVAGEIMYRALGATIEGYKPSEQVAPLWPGDTPKFNGHASKWYFGDEPTRIDGKPSDYIRRMKWGSILELLHELRSRHWLLKELRARADTLLFEAVDKEAAMAKFISSRYAEAHGMARGWRKWAKAIVQDLTPDEIKDLRAFLNETENPFPLSTDGLDDALADMLG